MNLRLSTAVTLIVGPILDADGVAKTDEVVANIRLSKNGTVAAPNAAATLTHDHAGKYKLALTEDDTDTLGCLQVSLTSGTNDMRVHDFNVATQETWDALYAASGGLIPADAKAWDGGALPTIGTSTLDAAGVRSAVGLSAANLDTQLAGLAGSTGSGAYTITVTVTDGTNPLESAKVRFTKGAESYLGTTNASGVATFALDSGTWAVAITLPLYTFTTTTKVVSATGAQTYAMTATSFPASAANQVTGYDNCYGSDGQPEAGVVVTLRQVDYPTATGGGYDTTARTATTDANGLAAFTGCWPGATYTIKGSGQARPYKIPASA